MEAYYDDVEYEDEGARQVRSRPQTEVTPTVKYRVGLFSILFLVGFAAFFDLLELILSLFTAGAGGYIKDFASYIVFPALFWLFKIPFWKGNKRIQKITTMIVGAIVALIPVVSDILPELTIAVIITIMYSRVEDKMGTQGQMLQKNPNIVRSRRVRPKIPRRR